MTDKIESRIFEGDIRWIEKSGSREIKLEGYIITAFRCSCGNPFEIRQAFPNDGTSQIYQCRFCKEEYLIEYETRNPITAKVEGKEGVELYRQIISTLQKIRGVKPQDKINLRR